MAQQEQAVSRWGEAQPYERYVGRWSRAVAGEFVGWLAVPPAATWADIGCGTGALTQAVLRDANPCLVYAFDKSPGFVAAAAAHPADPRARFEVADATHLPLTDAQCDVAVSGLVLNFVGQPAAMLAEMSRATRSGGLVASYVWDYAGGMQMMRQFWDAAVAVCGAAEVPDEASRLPLCAPGPLRALWSAAGLSGVVVRSVTIPTCFVDFNDYWEPFLGNQGAGPTWLAGRAPAEKAAIRDLVRSRLPVRPDGSIPMTAAAWAVKGTRV